jgi:hypothetical protein
MSELETVAFRLGIPVRTEPLGADPMGARGGLCRIFGRPLILLDAGLCLDDRIAILAAALSVFDVSSIHMPPAVRAIIDHNARNC